jgi:hypothetical protein
MLGNFRVTIQLVVCRVVLGSIDLVCVPVYNFVLTLVSVCVLGGGGDLSVKLSPRATTMLPGGLLYDDVSPDTESKPL